MKHNKRPNLTAPAKMVEYRLGTPPGLWRQVKAQAALEGTTVRMVVLKALRAYLVEANQARKGGDN